MTSSFNFCWSRFFFFIFIAANILDYGSASLVNDHNGTTIECGDSFCYNNGSCEITDDLLAVCRCKPGWKGPNCSQSHNPCDDHPCENRGRCERVDDGVVGYKCVCGEQYTGERCEIRINCTMMSCEGENEICVDDGSFVYCNCLPDYYRTSGGNCELIKWKECASHPCQNNATCKNTAEGYQCICTSNFKGKNCEIEFTETCFSKDNENLCLNNGKCVKDENGLERCYCTDFYSGKFCEIHQGKCRSQPCKNNATCLQYPLPPYFICKCLPGYDGDLCDVNINECVLDPCKNGGICTDLIDDVRCECQEGWTGKYCTSDVNECDVPGLVDCGGPQQGNCINTRGSFYCYCRDGWEGVNCEVETNECESSPCQHGGVCTDHIAAFTCDCAETGYHGDMCEIEIDECATIQPCMNNATCTDLINDYQCNCHPGYTGKNCSVDVDECLEEPCRHDGLCLQRSNVSYYGENPLFPAEFSYANASGFVCECAAGYTGEACEVEVNECEEWEPCEHNSTCIDLVADYDCICDEEFGGRNCSIQLIACLSHPCQNGGICSPFLVSEYPEAEHGYECWCDSGFTGSNCEQPTTFSFDYDDDSDNITANMMTVQHRNVTSSIDITFEFRTTVANRSLVQLVAGARTWKIDVRTDEIILNDVISEEPTLALKTPTTEGSWNHVSVTITPNHLTFQVNGVSDHHLTISELLPTNETISAHLTFGPFFVGCIRDVTTNNVTIPVESVDVTMSGNVRIGCNRKEQMCDVNDMMTCQSRGQCIDKWTDFKCICERPYHGKRCGEEVQAYTFGYLDQADSHAIFNVPVSTTGESNSLNISFFVIFSETNADVLTFGRANDTDELQIILRNSTFVVTIYGDYVSTSAVKIETGDILHKLNLMITPDEYLMNVQLEMDDVGVLGPPPTESHGRRKRDANATDDTDIITDYYVISIGAKESTNESLAIFKGLVQDVQINEYIRLLFNNSDVIEGDSKVTVTANSTHNILQGRISDPLCSSHPCLHGSECNLGFNHYTCDCGYGWFGDKCQTALFCSMTSPCPPGLTCEQITTDEMECRGVQTLPGERVEHRSYHVRDDVIMDDGSTFVSFRFRTRSADSLLVALRNDDITRTLVIETTKIGKLRVNFESTSELSTESTAEFSDGKWHQIQIHISNHRLNVTLDGVGYDVTDAEMTSQEDFVLVSSLHQLIISLGSFKGCMEDFRLNGHLVPLYTTSGLSLPFGYVPPLHMVTSEPSFAVVNGNCSSDDVCFSSLEGPCLNGGNCTDEFNQFQCLCQPGFTGERCETNIDDCSITSCSSTGICIDQIDGFICQCLEGYQGEKCEVDIDECMYGPCLNGGRCRNYEGGYQCICPSNFVGKNCSYSRYLFCGQLNNTTEYPCQNGGKCIMKDNNFSCLCEDRFVGDVCDQFVDDCFNSTCQNHGVCLQHKNGYTCECGRGYGGDKCEIITKCSSTTCMNGGTCINRSNSTQPTFQCICPPGLAGRRCETIDRCHRSPSTTTISMMSSSDQHYEFCSNGGTCRVTYPLNDSLPTFQCSCPFEFVGARCNYKNPCSNSTCANLATCVVTWDADDINKRSVESSVDRPTGTKIPPTFKCLCTEGFSGSKCEKDSKSRISHLIKIAGIVSGSFFLLLMIVLIFLIRMCLGRRAQSAEYHPNRAEQVANGGTGIQIPDKAGYVSSQMLHELKPPPPCERLI